MIILCVRQARLAIIRRAEEILTNASHINKPALVQVIELSISGKKVSAEQ